MRTLNFKGRSFASSNVLRQNQINNMREEIRLCENNIANAKYAPVDVKANFSRIKAIEDQLLQFEAKPFPANELDGAVKEERQIRKDLSESMLSNREMRHSAQGSASRHIRWENLNKPKILYWKGLRMRLHKSGIDFGVEADDVANLEVYRPRDSLSDPNFDTALIPVKTFHTVPETLGTKPEEQESIIDINIPAGTDQNPIVLERRFFALKKQTKELTGKAGKNKRDCLDLLDGAGIVYT